MKKFGNFIIFLQFKIREKLRNSELKFEQFSSKIFIEILIKFLRKFLVTFVEISGKLSEVNINKI